MNRRAYSVRVEGAKYGASFGSGPTIVTSYMTDDSIVWGIIQGVFELVCMSSTRRCFDADRRVN